MLSCIQVPQIRPRTEDLPLWSTSPTKQQPWPVGNSSQVLICHLSDLSVSGLFLSMYLLCLSIHCVLSICVSFFLFFDLHLYKLQSCAPWLYHRNFSAVGPVHSSGLGRTREGCGRGSYATGQSPLCKTVDDRVNDDTKFFFLI